MYPSDTSAQWSQQGLTFQFFLLSPKGISSGFGSGTGCTGAVCSPSSHEAILPRQGGVWFPEALDKADFGGCVLFSVKTFLSPSYLLVSLGFVFWVQN